MIKTKNNLFLAPLDNVNCAAFRLLCKEHGAGLVSTPMINTKKFLEERERFYWYKKERPLLVQFIGSEVDEFKECVKNISNCDVVDLNAGCPSPDQVQAGNGAALLKNLTLLKKITRVMVKYSPVPVSVKVRSGWEKDDSVKICKAVEAAGATFVTVHSRTSSQGFGTPADWNVIKKVKESVKIPVFASGDLLSPRNIRECFERTNCDGVTIARGAISNPFIFEDTIHHLKTGELVKHNVVERLDLIERFIELYREYDKFDKSELRNHCAWLVKSIKGARALRGSIGKCMTEEEIKRIIKERKKGL